MIFSLECLFCCILIVVAFIFVFGLPAGCCCVTPTIFLWTIFSILLVISGAIIVIFVLIVTITLTITTIESIILALYLEAIACFCCGQIPHIPFDFGIREWKLMTVLALFSSRIDFLMSSYSGFCRNYAERYFK